MDGTAGHNHSRTRMMSVVQVNHLPFTAGKLRGYAAAAAADDDDDDDSRPSTAAEDTAFGCYPTSFRTPDEQRRRDLQRAVMLVDSKRYVFAAPEFKAPRPASIQKRIIINPGRKSLRRQPSGSGPSLRTQSAYSNPEMYSYGNLPPMIIQTSSDYLRIHSVDSVRPRAAPGGKH
ncbi:hypothetical protein M885DRAFT_548110 [Pelagophyceae sp. CCMP2097]|nr:hypothetical protein M885DRAFT_548110 [Pelagophyceae sp. CCMP2097]|mmetsp:Transcript_34439/g.118713  ORF Transcript_34439/g.118713 Transcript_34439/m.118713 type:complete len:175 (-) Transcript_34439:251-775(-)